MSTGKSGFGQAAKARWRLLWVLPVLLTACDELGPGARGEIPTTALQTVGDDRACVPLDDMTAARPLDDVGLRVLLRDGTDWHNNLRGLCPMMPAMDEVAFVTETGDACAGDQLLLLQRSQSIARLAGTCVLGRFVQQ
ncbi:MAG: hypothetical protein AB7I04_17565 [Pseudomonadales bacterium]